jgi:hypothetical protein
MGKMGNTYNVLVEKPNMKRPLGRPGRRWEDNGVGRCRLDASSSG